MADYLAVEKGDKEILLALVDDFQGDDELERIKLLQAKLHRYLDFADSGEVFVEVDRIAGRPIPRTTPVKIRVYAMTEFGDDGKRFLLHAKEVAKQEGVELEVEIRSE